MTTHNNLKEQYMPKCMNIHTDWKLVDKTPAQLLSDKTWNAAAVQDLWQLSWVAEGIRKPELNSTERRLQLQSSRL